MNIEHILSIVTVTCVELSSRYRAEIDAMYFGILGPLEARHQDSAVPVGGAKRRALLIALLANANRNVPVERLMLWMWPDETPPRSAPLVIQAHVSALRQALEPDRRPRAEPRVLHTTPGGYLMELNQDELDVLEFEALMGSASQCLQRDELEDASKLLREALSLWRGAPLAEVHDLEVARGEVTRLEELRLTALAQYFEAGLRMGRYLELIPQLTVLIGEFPYHERFYTQLMIALAGCGRRAEALAVYRRAHRLLTDELGVEPGPELRAMEAAILQGDA
jgi:DNA-binding SARP family transcriptional activator